MHNVIARIMAILMLLSVFGQAAAQPCADMHTPISEDIHAGAPADLPHSAHREHGSADAPMADGHCGDMPSSLNDKSNTHCADIPSSANGDCGQTCTCCPSHCATVLPGAEAARVILPSSTHRVCYIDLASSAEPESAIKPPRSA
ncbi:hypothetical protein [Microbulbifer sp.]|uniref:hypothetical protein n=1 Tax=Microbulbifer sp. TaxID=1908541 RepID=UPI002F93AC5A